MNLEILRIKDKEESIKEDGCSKEELMLLKRGFQGTGEANRHHKDDVVAA